jgi:Flp pilus assembly secretin CpaC
MEKIYLSLLSLSKLLLIVVCTNTHAKYIDIELKKGGNKVLKFKRDVSRVDISSEGVVTVSVAPNNKRFLKIKAISRGEVYLSISFYKSKLKKDYRVSVSPNLVLDDATSQSIIKQILQLKTINYSYKDDQFVLKGKVSTVREAMMLDSLKDKYGEYILDQTMKPYLDISSTTKIINQTLVNEGFDNYKVKNIGKYSYIEGNPKSKEEKKDVIYIVKEINPEVKDSIEKVKNSNKKMFVIDAIFLQHTVNDDKDMGFTSGAGNSIGIAGLFKLEKKIGKLNFSVGPIQRFLSLITSYSSKRILSNPRVVVRSGEEASFRAGEEHFVDIYHREEETRSGAKVFIEKKETHTVNSGITFTVTPVASAMDFIDLSILLEVADFKREANTGTTAKLISKVNTNISVKDGNSIVINGLKKKEESKTIDKVPLLGDIPLFGELFKSRKIIKNENDIIILVTVKEISQEDYKEDAYSKVDNYIVHTDKYKGINKKALENISFSIFD